MLLEYQSTSQKTYMCGDYNIDLLKVNDLKFNEEYFHDILSAGYIPTITLPTRLSVSSSLIDNIFTTNLSNDISACILNVHISDHQPVIIFCNDEVPLSRTKYITITTNSDKAKTNFCQSFQNKQVFKRLDNNNDDPNHNYQILEESLINSHNECFPTRVVKFNRKRHKISPWMTNGILKSINHRHRLYKNLKQYKPDSFMYTEKQLQFNRYRNELKKTISHAKRSHYQDLFKQFKFDMKKTWAVLSEILNRKNRNSVPDNMTVNGAECSDKQAIAEHFNSFFASVGELNSKNITEHGDSSYRDYLSERIESNFEFRLVDSHNIKQIIKGIKTSRSNGHDGISSELLKLISNDIADSITLIINQSLKSGIFPNQLKIAKVTPIYKKDDKKIITNYRPISVLPVVSKVFETVIHEQLSDYFLSNNLFSAQQYGFRKNSSAELAALELIDRLLAQLKNHKIPINFYIDLTKAFDSLNHDILLDKLSYYGVNGTAKTLLKSYLSDRKQYVKIDEVKSSIQSIKTGVPQGSIVGPLLFNIFINDIIKSSKKFNFILYADDTTLNSTVDNFGNTTDEIQSSIISELQTICKWLDLNKLCLNVNKSKFMLFHMPQRVTPLLHFELNGSPIEYIQEFNFLGLTLDSSLSFKFHLTKIGNKISRVIGLLHKLKHIFPSYILRMIYNSLILPHMNYSLLAWGANCHSIELLQKKAVRVINFKSPLAHTEPILKGMDQLKLPDMYTCHLIKLYYKLYRNKLPAYFEKFIPEYGESQHDLRHNNIRLPAIRCEYEKMNAKFQMHYRLREFANPSRPPLYPTVHIDMDTLSQSLTRFSKYIKSQFISSYSFHCTINDCYTCQNCR